MRVFLEVLFVKKKKIVAVFAFVFLLILTGFTAKALLDENFSKTKSFGEIVSMQKENNDNVIVASYKNHPVTKASVELRKKIFELSEKPESEEIPFTDKSKYTDREYIDELIIEMILLEKATESGLAATDEEVKAQVEATKKLYEENAAARLGVTTYCETAGLTIDEYFEALPSLLAPRIGRGKYQLAFTEKYQNEHPKSDGIDALQAYEDYQRDLLKQCEMDIVYVTP